MKKLLNKIFIAWQWIVAVIAASILIAVPVAIIVVIILTFMR